MPQEKPPRGAVMPQEKPPRGQEGDQSMKTRAALLRQSPGTWSVEEVELDEPGHGEVLVEMVASGLCHSDDHFAQGDIHPARLPLCAGHEGSGVVRRLGPGVEGFE